jgi:hypothetical protein
MDGAYTHTPQGEPDVSPPCARPGRSSTCSQRLLYRTGLARCKLSCVQSQFGAGTANTSNAR